jgi:glucosamine-6-phosphate deaminase
VTLVQNSSAYNLGLATGSTPIKTYGKLVEHHRKGVSFEAVTTFNLDEYVGLTSEHPKSYHFYMTEYLFDHVDISSNQTHIPAGDTDDLDAECARYEREIHDSGGVDLWLLGIGSNGHIAFNEPGCSSDSRTRVIDLTPATVTANSRFFDSSDDVPRQAITVGIRTILEARRILLLACGGNKAEAICEAVAGPISADCPASYLQDHPDCTFLLDSYAASRLTQ